MNGTTAAPNGAHDKEAPQATAAIFRVQGNTAITQVPITTTHHPAQNHQSTTPLVKAEISTNNISKKSIAKDDIMIETLTSEQAASHEVVPCTHQLRTNLEEGLTTAEATRRRQYHGYNEFDVGEEEPIYKKYLEQFQNPLILLLLASAFVSIIMKQYDDAISITVAVVIVVTVGFVQEYRSEKTLEQLTKLVPPTCHVLRDGKETMMLARELVPGDIVMLNTGDRIPSDLRIAESFSLQIDESSLTGETEPKHKETRAVPQATIGTGSDVEHLTCIAFMGTLVCAGRGRGIVISTAANSQFGEVVKMMMGEESPKTPLQKSMDDLGKQLSIYSFGVIAVIFLIGMFQHFPKLAGFLKIFFKKVQQKNYFRFFQGRNVVDMFTIGVSLAVAAIPEGLPIVVAVTLAIGVMRMAKRRAVVKKMPAVETLGCVTVICSDKTGTLTKNEMTAQSIATPEGKLAEITGIGYSPDGGVVQYQGELVQQWSHPEFARIIEAGIVCNNATIEADKLIGQPTEGAIVVLAKKAQLEGVRTQYKRLREMPFSSETKWMGVQCADTQGQTVYFIKGALDRVLDQCGTYYSADNQRKQCDQYSRQHILEIGKELGGRGLRVLGFARGESMQSLMFLGMIGMMDPPRPGAADAISIVKASGVDVKLITGDAMETAQSIGEWRGRGVSCTPPNFPGQSLGILSSSDSCLSGQQVDQMSDQDLELVIRQVTVFYRASPRHKLKIVKALQSLGEVVAMTGDGVNDAMSADNKVTPRDTTMTFTCFVLFDMWNALSCRSSRKMIWQIGIRRNRMFCLAVSASLICQLLVIYWSPLQHIFQTEALSLFDLIFLTTITSTVFIFNETRKYFNLRSKSLNHDPLSVSGI
ncbi:hypothetical protein CAEBREN_29375 [Caenorhabditis brenneri]|uniref:P-type Ca(2+) transporter n=1 Tax=Caenorhabditis brenneri TaxID=135651 RepID=G0MIP9_CAEBE|nr:hypothetical protein CAEBREN_29375 [Caenorhabditis brenneri]